MKKTVSVLGVALLLGAVALAQTSSTATSSKSKKTSATSTSTQGASDTATTSSSTAGQSSDASTSNSTGSQVKAGNSGFDDVVSSTPSSSTSASSEMGSANATSSGSTASPEGSSAMRNSGERSATRSGSTASQLITNGPVAETVADTTVLIGWATHDAASNTGVKYGTNRANMTETAQGTDASGKNHHARLQGLQPNTQYFFQVTENGSPVGGVGTFKTTASGDAPVQSKAVIPQK